MSEMIRNPRNRDFNEIHYFTAKTLPELEKKVNENIEKFNSQADESQNENVHYSAEIYSDLKYVNEEYVQVVQFCTWERMFRPRRKAAKTKVIEDKEKTDTESIN